MTSDAELRHREAQRREALWMLAHILPGDVRALDVLDVLDDIELRERLDTGSMEQPLSVEEVLRFVPTKSHPIGCRIVRESSIPQPWRERFLRASVGSTRVPEGLYARDWDKFLVEWQNEMRHLEKHRAARGKNN
ncbi:hypothetical protein [Pseudomonas fluorescens]|uniref:hypothetical protein n=1 Tax=Pseudomonas fluorescens TaxID=294 RepID=UPI001BEC5FE2|nr:hypothetical protein [Pseudomonas fluorescens]MBT2374399.1 hypothetical protein [Pseudomonas fluorescens]